MTITRDPDAPGFGLLKNKSDAGLLAEWHYWNNIIREATSWGGSLGGAKEFRDDAVVELRRRNLEIPMR